MKDQLGKKRPCKEAANERRARAEMKRSKLGPDRKVLAAVPSQSPTVRAYPYDYFEPMRTVSVRKDMVRGLVEPKRSRRSNPHLYHVEHPEHLIPPPAVRFGVEIRRRFLRVQRAEIHTYPYPQLLDSNSGRPGTDIGSDVRQIAFAARC